MPRFMYFWMWFMEIIYFVMNSHSHSHSMRWNASRIYSLIMYYSRSGFSGGGEKEKKILQTLPWNRHFNRVLVKLDTPCQIPVIYWIDEKKQKHTKIYFGGCYWVKWYHKLIRNIGMILTSYIVHTCDF